MAVDVAVVQQALPTGTGTFDVTKTGFGTPKAYMTFVTNAITNGTAIDNAVIAIGVGDGTREAVLNVSAEHNQAITDTYNRQMADESVSLILPTTGAIDGEANFNSFITDGVRFTIGNAFGTAALLTTVLFGGSDLTAFAQNASIPGNAGVATSITAPNFRPDVVFFGGSLVAFTDGANANHRLSWGAATDEASIMQGVTSWTCRDNVSTPFDHNFVHDARCVAHANFGSTTINRSAELTSFLSTGFELTKRDGGGVLHFTYLALDFGGAVNYGFNHFTSPIATGSLARSALGFKPQYVNLGLSFCDTLNVIESVESQGAGAFGISNFDATIATCIGASNEDAVAGNSNTQSLTHNRPVSLARGNGTVVHDGTFTSFDTNGYTLNFGTADGTARRWFEVGIEENAAAGGAVGPLVGSGRLVNNGGPLVGPGRLVGL